MEGTPDPGIRREGDAQSGELADLMVSYQEGKWEAFEALYSILKPRLYRYLLSVTFDAASAEDLLQDTFLQLHRARRTYQPSRPVLPWVFAIARHTYLKARRAGGRRRKRELPQPEELYELPVPPEADRWADHELIRRALTQVSEERREALLLHHVWGFTFEEIGASLGIRKGAAKLRAYRGMQDLRRAVESAVRKTVTSGTQSAK